MTYFAFLAARSATTAALSSPPPHPPFPPFPPPTAAAAAAAPSPPNHARGSAFASGDRGGISSRSPPPLCSPLVKSPSSPSSPPSPSSSPSSELSPSTTTSCPVPLPPVPSLVSPHGSQGSHASLGAPLGRPRTAPPLLFPACSAPSPAAPTTRVPPRLGRSPSPPPPFRPLSAAPREEGGVFSAEELPC